MKGMVSIILLSLLCSSVFSLFPLRVKGKMDCRWPDDTPSQHVQSTAEWTFMVYLDGDNDLESYAVHDLNEMEAAQSSGSVNILVQFDRIPGGDSSNGDWTTTRRYLVTHDTDTLTIHSTMIVDLGELNMGDPSTLINFVEWGISNYPAFRYALVLWDHGNGWRASNNDNIAKGVCSDETSLGDLLTMQELESALNQIGTDTGVKLDILGFDACMMGMLEVDYQIGEYADYRVGSEDVEPGNGWFYTNPLTALASNPAMDALDLATQFVTAYLVPYGTGGDETLSATNLNMVGNIKSTTDTLAQRLYTDLDTGSYRTAIETCRTMIQSYDDPEFVDLYDFAWRIGNSPELPAETRQAANALTTAIGNYVVAETHGSDSSGSHGLSVYFPDKQQSYETTYDDLPFAQDTQWDEFVKKFQSAPPDVYEPDPSFSQYSAMDVTSSLQSQFRSIEPAGDEDYIRFYAYGGRKYIFYTESSIDTYGSLYDSIQYQLTSDDDDGEGTNFRIEYDITSSGYYFLKVRGYSSSTSGPYTLYYSYESVDVYEPDPSFSQYSAMDVTSSLQSQFRSIVPAGDEDYIRFYAYGGNKYIFYTSSSLDTYGNLYDSSHVQLTYDDDDGEGTNFRIEYDITSSGYYFLKVRGYSSSTSGPYTLYYSYESVDNYEPDNSFSQYSTIIVTSSLQSQNRSIFPAGDEDYIRFYAYGGNKYIFYTESSIDTYGSLYDSSHVLLASDDDDGEGTNFRIEYDITSSGYHFLKVRGYSSSIHGPYTLYYSYESVEPLHPLIESCDQNGANKDAFNVTDTVYVYGANFSASTTYAFYVTEDVTWIDGMPIPPRVMGTATTVSSDSSGNIPTTAVWDSPLVVGKFDIVIDTNGNGVYDHGVDALDDNDVEVTAGIVIPEFSQLFIIPLFVMATPLVFIIYIRKRPGHA